MLARGAVPLFLLTFALPLLAAPAHVVVRPATADVQVKHVVVEASSGGSTERFRIALNDLAPIDVQPGARLQVVEPDAYWSAPVVLRDGETAELTLYRSAVVTTRVEPPKGERPPRELGVAFEITRERQVRRVETTCPVAADGAMRCRLPALPLDLRFSAPGFAPHYVWDSALSAREPTKLPAISLRRGGSVVGWVASEVDGTSLEELTVRLAPMEYGAAPQDVRLLSHTVRPTRRGFFQFVGVPPGMWRVTAEGKGVSPSKVVTVEVDERQETALRDELAVRQLASLDIDLTPPIDPAGKPWQIRLQRRNSSHYLEPVVTSAATANGQWSHAPVEAGEYVLRVNGSDGAAFHRRDLVIEAGAPPLHITIDAFPLIGRVLVGSDGVAAKLTLRSDSGEKITTTSDEGGAYQAILPFAGLWRVEVLLTSSDQEVSPPPIRVTRREGEPTRADIILPAGRIRGRAVDENGQPVQASVFVTREGSPIAAMRTSGGAFDLVGIEPGPVLVTAATSDATSGATAATASDMAAPLTLVVRKSSKIKARLVTASGRPIAGASIRYSTPRSTFPGQETSSPSGRFEMTTEADAAAVTLAITAPGFPSKLMLLPNPRHRESVDIVLGSVASRMIVRPAGNTPPWPLIGHAGAFAPMISLIPPRRGPGRPEARLDEGWALDLEPGDYLVCAAPDELSNCIQRRLAPGATVLVEAPRRQRGSGSKP